MKRTPPDFSLPTLARLLCLAGNRLSPPLVIALLLCIHRKICLRFGASAFFSFLSHFLLAGWKGVLEGWVFVHVKRNGFYVSKRDFTETLASTLCHRMDLLRLGRDFARYICIGSRKKLVQANKKKMVDLASSTLIQLYVIYGTSYFRVGSHCIHCDAFDSYKRFASVFAVTSLLSCSDRFKLFRYKYKLVGVLNETLCLALFAKGVFLARKRADPIIIIYFKIITIRVERILITGARCFLECSAHIYHASPFSPSFPATHSLQERLGYSYDLITAQSLYSAPRAHQDLIVLARSLRPLNKFANEQ